MLPMAFIHNMVPKTALWLKLLLIRCKVSRFIIYLWTLIPWISHIERVRLVRAKAIVIALPPIAAHSTLSLNKVFAVILVPIVTCMCLQIFLENLNQWFVLLLLEALLIIFVFIQLYLKLLHCSVKYPFNIILRLFLLLVPIFPVCIIDWNLCSYLLYLKFLHDFFFDWPVSYNDLFDVWQHLLVLGIVSVERSSFWWETIGVSLKNKLRIELITNICWLTPSDLNDVLSPFDLLWVFCCSLSLRLLSAHEASKYYFISFRVWNYVSFCLACSSFCSNNRLNLSFWSVLKHKWKAMV